MATNKIVENDEREENKKGIIIFVVILLILLALFIGIRALSDKNDKKQKEDKKPIEQVEEKEENEKEEAEDTTYVYTPKKSTKVKKTSNEEKKDTLTLVLKGGNVIYVDYADRYIDEGAYALDTKEGDLSIAVVKTIYLNGEVADAIDTTNSGATYTISYTVTNSRGETKEIIRTVIIKEAEVTISLNGNSKDNMEYNVSNPSTYNDLGATAVTSDGTNIPVTTTITKDDENYIGSITSDVLGNYVITYTATYNKKEFKVERNVVVEDTTAPVITTEKDMYLYRKAQENEDTEITLEEIKNLFTVSDEDSNITTTLTDSNSLEIANINKAIVGEYTVILTATDSSNNTNAKAIVIKVKEDEAPIISVTTTNNNNEYQFTVNVEDDFTATENITLSYAVINNVGGEIINFVDLESNVFTITKADELSETAIPKYVIVKATDENGNESISDFIEVTVEP